MLPEVTVVEITGTDSDGEVLARPVQWKGDGDPPVIYMAPDRHGTPALGRGDRVLARLTRTGEGSYDGRPIRRLAGAPKRVLGIFEDDRDGGRLRPTDRRVKTDFRIAREDTGGAAAGELVLAEVLHSHRLGWLQARVVERVGRMGEPRSVSLISIHEHEIPTAFPSQAIALAEQAVVPPLGERADLRPVPLVTFDGADVTGLRPHQLFHRGMLRTFQIAHEFSHMTALENLMMVPSGQPGESLLTTWVMPAKVKAADRAVQQKALDVIDFLKLGHVKNELAGNLSGGQKKLLELGRTMMVDAKVVLLDEVAAGVNRTLLQDLAANIERMNRELGYTFFVIEHDMDLIGRLCDPVIVMAQGEVIAQGPMAEIRANPQIIEAYFGTPVEAAE